MKTFITTTLKLGFVLMLFGAFFFAYDASKKIQEENNATIEDQILVTESGLEIELIGEGSLNKKRVEGLIQDIEELPEDLRSNCSKVIITNKTLDQIDPDASPDFSGLADSYTGRILLGKDADTHSVRHEMMHLHDYYTRGDGISISDTAEFQTLANELIQKGSNKISTRNTAEVYADFGAYFIAQDRSLRSESPELYEFFKNQIFPDRFQ